MQINSFGLDFDDVLILPQYSEVDSRADVNLVTTFTTPHSKRNITGIPIIAANLDTVATFKMAKALSQFNIFTCLHKFYSESELINFFNNAWSEYAFYTTGINQEDINKLTNIAKHCKIDKICVDVPNGYMKKFLDTVKRIREIFPNSVLMAGNVCTYNGSKMLDNIGVDIIKVGIGSGSKCKTKDITGVGNYQLSAIDNCTFEDGLICSDGGCNKPGDVCKSFAAGASFVMLGGMFAGHSECDGEWEYENEIMPNNLGIPVLTGRKIKKSLKTYGMSSQEAMEKYYGGVADYRTSEGKCIQVPYRGDVRNTVLEILGGLSSCCSYSGVNDLKDLSKNAIFVKKE